MFNSDPDHLEHHEHHEDVQHLWDEWSEHGVYHHSAWKQFRSTALSGQAVAEAIPLVGIDLVAM